MGSRYLTSQRTIRRDKSIWRKKKNSARTNTNCMFWFEL
uniref:Uncharacterized protein n=1 Tax=Rhizophora mucronata TaxID=61149 RepID=A0A2P2NEU6_RHIMU